ncbi:MAG: DNA repair protein RecN [Ruminococcaceae bacterium]|nr:DNA repair protein RecN [Oscillospiraceae bacterium]
MLRSLHIENVAVIRSVDLEPGYGFSVLTGETGAGKSIIIDSINLLLGNRASRELIRSGSESATVSAVFEDLPSSVCDALHEMGFTAEDASLMLQKTIFADGRSQTRLDGRVITQSIQRQIARMLVSIHGQSDNQKLLQKKTHAELLDAYLHPAAEKVAYREAYAALRDVQKKLQATQCDESEKLRLREMLAFQIADIDALKLKPGEEEVLTAERDRLANLEQINQKADFVYRALRGAEKGSAYSLTARAGQALQSISGLIDGADELVERLEAVSSELEDIAELARAYMDDDREDPTARIDRIESRLEAISKLKRKYGESIPKILEFREQARCRLEELDFSEERLDALRAEEAALLEKATALAGRLTVLRRAAAEEIVAKVTEALSFLDMPKVRFEISILSDELRENGADDVEFMIATNPGEPLLPMIKIASGGELSRIMLALRSVLNDRDGATTVIFDEIDTGVSGKTSRKIGMMLRKAARDTQVLCVTHSAQIASLAQTHFLISKKEEKGRTETDVIELCDNERVEEVARILGGIEITDAQREAAREMIDEYVGGV